MLRRKEGTRFSFFFAFNYTQTQNIPVNLQGHIFTFKRNLVTVVIISKRNLTNN